MRIKWSKATREQFRKIVRAYIRGSGVSIAEARELLEPLISRRLAEKAAKKTVK